MKQGKEKVCVSKRKSANEPQGSELDLVQLTSRDEVILEWLFVVRQADLEALRWAMGAAGDTDDGSPVTLRNAQRWMMRMHGVGLIGRARPAFRAGSILWPTHVPGLRPPDLYRQTVRHELAVATVSARYLAAGYTWSRDRRAETMQDHQADGLAVKDGRVELVEVELTPKTKNRYRVIHTSHADRITEGVSRVVYICTPAAARTVSREADRHIFRDIRPRLVTLPAVDNQGKWIASDEALWQDMLPTVPAPHLEAPELFDGRFA